MEEERKVAAFTLIPFLVGPDGIDTIDFFIQKHQSIHCLVLSRGRHMLVDCKVCQKRFDLCRAVVQIIKASTGYGNTVSTTWRSLGFDHDAQS